jgi:hypothetical protein
MGEDLGDDLEAAMDEASGEDSGDLGDPGGEASYSDAGGTDEN